MTVSKKTTFEETLAQLEAASEQLKKENITLEEAIASFEAGVGHYNTCSKILDEAKQKIETYSK